MDKIKVLLIEDQDLLLDGMSLSLEASGEIEIVGKFKDIADYFTFENRSNVDVILTDVCCANNHNSIDFVKEIKEDNPSVKIVMMTSVMEINFIDRAKNAGADSFVYKTIPTKELITIIHNVMNGYETFPISKKEEISFLKNLTDKELNIIRLYCQGNNRKEIAQKLSFSESSIKNTITLILEKTGFASMSKFAIWLMQNGFII
ncbi:MAG: response regulator [Christensenellales bacterium]